MKTFALYVYCRRNGITCDAGEHARCEAETYSDAVTELEKEIPWLRQFYDEVSWEVKEVEQ